MARFEHSCPHIPTNCGGNHERQVKGEAQGEEASLKKLKSDLNQGPRAAHVVKLEFNEIDPKDGESSFIAS